MSKQHKRTWRIEIFFVSLVGALIFFTIAEKVGVPNYDLPFGWNTYSYDICSGADYQSAAKQCKEICPQSLKPGTRGNGFPFTVDYSECDPNGGRANAFAAPLNLAVAILAAAGTSWLAVRRNSFVLIKEQK